MCLVDYKGKNRQISPILQIFFFTKLETISLALKDTILFMKNALVTIWLLFSTPLLGFGQLYPEGEDVFFYERGLTFARFFSYEIERALDEEDEEINEPLDNNDCDKELRNFILKNAHSEFEAVIKHFPNSEYLIPSLFYKGRIEYLLGEDSAAYSTFNKLFALPLISCKEVPRTIDYKSPQPIENFYHGAALAMAKLCMRNNNFEEAIYYLESTNNKYKRYHYSCLIAVGAERAQKRILEAICHFELKNYEEVIKLLLPYAFDDDRFHLSNHTQMLSESLRKVYTQKQLLNAFKKGFQNLKKIDFRWQFEFYNREGYSMPFLNETIIFEPLIENKLVNLDAENEYYKWMEQTKFYKLLFNSN